MRAKNKIFGGEEQVKKKINMHLTTQRIYVVQQHAYIHQRL
jgi:hypothetical protein